MSPEPKKKISQDMPRREKDQPSKEPIAPKKKGELPPDLAEPVVGGEGSEKPPAA